MSARLSRPFKLRSGPCTNWLVIGENLAAAMEATSPASADFLKRYSAKAAAAGIDPLGFAWGPFAYGAGQVLAQAVTETKSLDHDVLAAYLHKASFKTVAGDFSFAQDGEWSKARQVWTQFQNVQPSNLDQFKAGQVQPIVWPPEAKTGNVIYPYGEARKK